MKATYNKSKIMRNAWYLKRANASMSFSACLKKAWRNEKLAILTAVYTGGNTRGWVFYTRTVRVFGERLNEALASHEAYPISIYTEQDPEWEEYQDMYEMKQWAAD